MGELRVLDTEMYSEAGAARLLTVSQSTLHYWLEGGQMRGKTYAPVIRRRPTGDRAVTWAEFVEAALLREYRQTHGIPMAQLRSFIEDLRDRFEVPYPLADRRPLVSGRELVMEAQQRTQLDPDYWLVTVASKQHILTPAAESWFERVEWDEDTAAAWRPAADAASTVRIRPNVRGGRPAVQGISTEALWEQNEAGEAVADLARVYDLAARDVRWALAYENGRQAGAQRSA